MKKIFAAFLLVVAIAFVSPVQAQSNFNFDENFQILTTGRAPEGIVVNITTYLSVREGPSVYSRELDRIPNGTRVAVTDSSNGFYYIFYWGNSNNYWGYAHSSYIRMTGGYFDLP